MKSKDDKRHNKDRVKSSYIMIRTTFFLFFFSTQFESEREEQRTVEFKKQRPTPL